jgi:transcriptional regulator with XRE-family HTH domain
MVQNHLNKTDGATRQARRSDSNDGEKMTIGSKLKELRVKNNLSLQDLANAVDASKAHIWDIERGASKNPSLELLKKIADHFKISIGELVGEKPDAVGEPEDLIALYRGLKDLTPSDRETISVLMQRLKNTRDK